MCELTPMQAACWFGRAHNMVLGGVSAHLYTEFNSRHINLARLNQAVLCLYRRHDMLRLQLGGDGQISWAAVPAGTVVEVDDYSSLSAHEQQQQLGRKRQQWTHQQLNLQQAQTLRISVSLLAKQAFRLHLDADMIAVDPSSFRILMADLAGFYENLNMSLPPAPAFFNWYRQWRQDPACRQQQQRARAWWQARLADIAPAPALPLTVTDAAGAIHSTRLSTLFSRQQLQQLRQTAQQHQLTFSAFMLSLFAYTLGSLTQDAAYRLNVPVFWREPVLPDIAATIGDFANMVLLNVDMSSTAHLLDFCRRIASELNQCLDHSHYSGVNVMRQLSRLHGSPQMTPVVFTAALDLSGNNLFSERVHQHFGSMDWCISQGAQVALDVQLVQLNHELLINWDIRQEALSASWVQALSERYNAVLNAILAQPPLLTAPLPAIDQLFSPAPATRSMTKPLNALQKAYLAGRTAAFPLGGVAMQEYREYSGTLDVAALRQRLTEMVQHHPSLRTHIDERRCVQWVSPEVRVNLDEMDLSAFEPAVMAEKIQVFRQRYQQALFDLQQSPWNITLIQTKPQQFILCARFDALILDGRAIASLMLELLAAAPLGSSPAEPEAGTPDDAAARAAALNYWRKQLYAVTSIPQLPWKQPLATLMTSGYHRQSAVIAAPVFHALSQRGGRQGLFKNALLMSVILAVLNQWNQDKNSLAVAVPVLPLSQQPLSNHATFMVIRWSANTSLTEQAKRLQAETLEGLQHLAFSGADLARLLLEQNGSAPVLPVVVTNGLSWPALPARNAMHYTGGLTQTPQVALDIRFTSRHDGALVFHIDYAQAAIADELIARFLMVLTDACHDIADNGLDSVNLNQDFSGAGSSQPHRHNNSTLSGNTTTTQQLCRIYQQALNISNHDLLAANTHFSELGLRPNHLKGITAEINHQFKLALSPMQLIRCRNMDEVAELVSKQTASVL